MSASIKFLTGRYVHVDGFVFRDDNGVEHPDKFLVVGIAPAHHGDGMLQVQDALDGDVSIVPADSVHPI